MRKRVLSQRCVCPCIHVCVCAYVSLYCMYAFYRQNLKCGGKIVASASTRYMWFSIEYFFSLDNVAEQLFAEMPEKNGASYDVLIQGLVKVCTGCHACMFVLVKQNTSITPCMFLVLSFRIYCLRCKKIIIPQSILIEDKMVNVSCYFDYSLSFIIEHLRCLWRWGRKDIKVHTIVCRTNKFMFATVAIW